jgi:hypothetical protein
MPLNNAFTWVYNTQMVKETLTNNQNKIIFKYLQNVLNKLELT